MSVVDTGDAVPSGLSAQETNDCSMNDPVVDQPSPTHDDCGCVVAVCASTLPES